MKVQVFFFSFSPPLTCVLQHSFYQENKNKNQKLHLGWLGTLRSFISHLFSCLTVVLCINTFICNNPIGESPQSLTRCDKSCIVINMENWGHIWFKGEIVYFFVPKTMLHIYIHAGFYLIRFVMLISLFWESPSQ